VRTQKRRGVGEMEIISKLYDYLYMREFERRKRKPVIEELAFLEHLY